MARRAEPAEWGGFVNSPLPTYRLPVRNADWSPHSPLSFKIQNSSFNIATQPHLFHR